MFRGIAADAPSRQHLRHWEQVCLYLDSQPYRALRYPFPTDPAVTARLLRRMARFGLVRHKDDCSWQLSLRWRLLLRRLWDGMPEEVAAALSVGRDTAPFVVDQNVDTLYVNLLAPALPRQLARVCTTLKTQAQEADQPVETPWRMFDAPLSMWKAGVGTSEKNKGVSWSFLLRNAYVMLRLRKTPLQQLVGSIRFSAECLWTYGARQALDEAKDALAKMWATPEEEDERFDLVIWRLSQLHLCVDVANFAPEPADLERIVTHARKKAVHIPSVDEAIHAFAADQGNDTFLGTPPDDWSDLSVSLFESLDLAMEQLLLEEDDGEEQAERDEPELEHEVAPVDESGAAVYLWGRRASGFAFAPGAALSAVIYDKALEERRSGKRWMETIHIVGGWRAEMPLFRVEGRFTREILREIAVGMKLAPGGWCDDPWLGLHHLNDFWAYFVGLPPEHDTAPDATHLGWLRLTQPQAGRNRARWPVDPVWEVIQRAQFSDQAPQPLRRGKEVAHDLEQIDAELYGLFKLRSVLSGRQEDETLTLSLELRAFAEQMDMVDLDRERDYFQEVREKARMLGKAVPPSKAVVKGMQ
jgi:hypothetical protein